MLRERKTETDFVTDYDIRPGNEVDLVLQPQSLHEAILEKN